MAVMSYLHTMVKGKRLHGTHGMHGLKRLLFLEIATKHRSYDSSPSPPPTTQAALILHIKRAAYQAVCIWGQETTICQMETKSLAYWGWKKQDDIWQMFWTVLPPIAQSCQQLMKSGCKTKFHGSCKCYCFSLPCISLCSCNCGGYNLFMIFA